MAGLQMDIARQPGPRIEVPGPAKVKITEMQIRLKTFPAERRAFL
ncbi:hypothetical protein ACLE20_02855 [Rhizobium sp. YIM 134829]